MEAETAGYENVDDDGGGIWTGEYSNPAAGRSGLGWRGRAQVEG